MNKYVKKYSGFNESFVSTGLKEWRISVVYTSDATVSEYYCIVADSPRSAFILFLVICPSSFDGVEDFFFSNPEIDITNFDDLDFWEDNDKIIELFDYADYKISSKYRGIPTTISNKPCIYRLDPFDGEMKDVTEKAKEYLKKWTFKGESSFDETLKIFPDLFIARDVVQYLKMSLDRGAIMDYDSIISTMSVHLPDFMPTLTNSAFDFKKAKSYSKRSNILDRDI